MKKLKYAFWFLLIVFLGLLVYQNLPYFTAKHSLEINLGIYQRSTPDLANGAIIAIFVGISVLIMMVFYFASRYESYRAKKAIKELRDGIADSTSTISHLKQEVEQLKSGVAPAVIENQEAEAEVQSSEAEESGAGIAQTTQA
jgi:biopolymer transport protein ExbB/TolQ